MLTGSGHGIFATDLGGLPWQLSYAVLWYLLSFAPNLLIGFIYARRTRAVTLKRALVLGHLMIIWNYVGYVAVWRATFRMIFRRTNWTKTTRSSEGAESALDRPTVHVAHRPHPRPGPRPRPRPGPLRPRPADDRRRPSPRPAARRTLVRQRVG
jgi:hypothetical protein